MAAARKLPQLFNIVSNRFSLRPIKLLTNNLRHVSAQSNVNPDNQDELSTQLKSKTLNPFDTINETNRTYLNELTIPARRSFNLAAYVNQSETLQQLIKLGVSLFDIENTNRDAARYYVTLDFDKDCVNHIKFLVDNGLKERNLGRFISEFPMIFEQRLDDLQVRINYLEHKGFTKKQIASALNRSAHIIRHPTKSLDHKLGEIQIEFNLPAYILRHMISRQPDLVGMPDAQYKLVNFTIAKEFGFRLSEIHEILYAQPSVLLFQRPILIDRLDFVHNTMKLSHAMIAKTPKLITGPIVEITQRFRYLEKLKRNQFDPKKPLFVPPTALYNISDEEFCAKYAKTNLEDYKLFIKSR